MATDPIRLHPENPRYFLFRGQPTVLITVGEHYGSVINLDFDYIPYLDTLQAHGFNLTRLFSGAFVAHEISNGVFRVYTGPLAPRPNRLLVPWARSETPGYSNGGNKFDLDRWDDTYFARLTDFVAQAGRRGIVVEFVFFSQQYEENHWMRSPLHAANNVNDLPVISWHQFTTTDCPPLLAHHCALVRQVVTGLNGFDNIYFEICNEPNHVPRPGGTIDWHNHLIDVISETEALLPHRHLIATNYDRADLLARLHPAISVHNVHYAYGSFWIGGLGLLEQCSHLPGALALDETADADFNNTIQAVRTDAWEMILGGGAVYDHLSWSYTTDDERGSSMLGRLTRQHLHMLKEFIGSFDFVHMRPDRSVVGPVTAAKVQALCAPGQSYAIYINTKDGPRQHDLSLALPAGSYHAAWIDPLTGAEVATTSFAHAGETKRLAFPLFTHDIALAIRAAP
jgi:hypothetical protein